MHETILKKIITSTLFHKETLTISAQLHPTVEIKNSVRENNGSHQQINAMNNINCSYKLTNRQIENSPPLTRLHIGFSSIHATDVLQTSRARSNGESVGCNVAGFTLRCYCRENGG